MSAPSEFPVAESQGRTVLGTFSQDFNTEVQLRPHHKRTVFTAEQKEELEYYFSKGRYIQKEDCLALAKKLKLETKTIQVWFKNRRTKARRQRMNRKEETEPSAPAHNLMIAYAPADTTAPSPADGPAPAYVHAPAVSTVPAPADGTDSAYVHAPAVCTAPAPADGTDSAYVHAPAVCTAPAPADGTDSAYVHAPGVSTAGVPAPHQAPVPRPAPANVPEPWDPAFSGSAGFNTPAPSTSFGLWPRAQFANDYSQDQASGAPAEGTQGNYWAPSAYTQYPNPMGYSPDSTDSNFYECFTNLQSPSSVSQSVEESVDLMTEDNYLLSL